MMHKGPEAVKRFVDIPEVVLDDLGIYHELEIPLPTVYKRKACSCGKIHKWEAPETFELYGTHLVPGGEFLGLPEKIVKRCVTCKETLLLEKDE